MRVICIITVAHMVVLGAEPCVSCDLVMGNPLGNQREGRKGDMGLTCTQVIAQLIGIFIDNCNTVAPVLGIKGRDIVRAPSSLANMARAVERQSSLLVGSTSLQQAMLPVCSDTWASVIQINYGIFTRTSCTLPTCYQPYVRHVQRKYCYSSGRAILTL